MEMKKQFVLLPMIAGKYETKYYKYYVINSHFLDPLEGLWFEFTTPCSEDSEAVLTHLIQNLYDIFL